MNLTDPLVPKWLPPTQQFWGWNRRVLPYATLKQTELEVRARLEEAYFWSAALRSIDPHGFRETAMYKWGNPRLTELRDQIDALKEENHA